MQRKKRKIFNEALDIAKFIIENLFLAQFKLCRKYLISFYLNQQDYFCFNYLQSRLMDFALDKRLKFRQNIRAKAIEKIKKSKRQLFHQHNERTLRQTKQAQLYYKILSHPHHIYQQKETYLQLLRQALNWEKVNKYKYLMADILLMMVKFYEQEKQLDENALILVIECIALVYYQTVIQFDQLTLKTFQIVFQNLKNNKHGEGNIRIMRNRCLIAIQNISSTENNFILSELKKAQVLEDLEQMCQHFPIQDTNKIIILNIYGNLISFYLSAEQAQICYYFPQLINHCIIQNYNCDVLNKANEIIISLFSFDNINKLDVVEKFQFFYAQILSSGFYVEDTEQLLQRTSKYFALDYSSKQNKDLYEVIPKIWDLIQLLTRRYLQHLNAAYLCQSYFWMAVIISKHFKELEQQKLAGILRQVCNAWVDIQDDCSDHFQLYFLKLSRLCLTQFSISYRLFRQSQEGAVENNAIKASTWEIISQFLIQVRLQQPQKCIEYLLILGLEHLPEMLKECHKQGILQKLEGCLYNKKQNNEISFLAERALKMY